MNPLRIRASSIAITAYKYIHLMTSILSHGSEKATVPTWKEDFLELREICPKAAVMAKRPHPTLPIGVLLRVCYRAHPGTQKIITECILCGHGGNSRYLLFTYLFSERKENILRCLG